MTNKNKGFTLIEVLIALIVVTLVFFSGLLLLSEMTKHRMALEDKTFASLAASNTLTRVRIGLLVLPGTDPITEVTQLGNREWSIHTNKSERDVSGLSMITVTVRDASEMIHYELKGYISEPKDGV